MSKHKVSAPSTVDDNYEPIRMFRRDIFNVSLDYLEADMLNERQVVELLKDCLEFFWSSSSQDVVKDFCITKVRRARRSQDATT